MLRNTTNAPKSTNKTAGFLSSFFKQSHVDFKASHAKRSHEPFHAFTRYLPHTEDLPFPLGDNKYTVLRQGWNVIALASCLLSSKEDVALALLLTLVLNMFMQHVVYPNFPTDNEVTPSVTSRAVPS